MISYIVLWTSPQDCGFTVWVKPSVETDTSSKNDIVQSRLRVKLDRQDKQSRIFHSHHHPFSCLTLTNKSLKSGSADCHRLFWVDRDRETLSRNAVDPKSIPVLVFKLATVWQWGISLHSLLQLLLFEVLFEANPWMFTTPEREMDLNGHFFLSPSFIFHYAMIVPLNMLCPYKTSPILLHLDLYSSFHCHFHANK